MHTNVYMHRMDFLLCKYNVKGNVRIYTLATEGVAWNGVVQGEPTLIGASLIASAECSLVKWQ